MALLAASCGDAGTPSDGSSTSTDSYVGTWLLTEGRGRAGEVPLIEGYRITLDIRNGEVGGTAACNSYGGAVDIVGDRFRLDDGLGMTAIGCEPEVMESEAAFIESLSAVDAISRQGTTLTLTGPGTELRFELLPAVPIRQLTDTAWQLESLIEGVGPDALAVSAAPARLLLKSDGKVSGSTGCREFEGEWVESGDEILFWRLSAEGRCPRRLQQQDGHVLGVLGDGFTADLEGQQLVLSSKGGLGLHYTAGSTG